MVWVDGGLAVQKFDGPTFGGHEWLQVGNSYRVKLHPLVFNPKPGTLEVTVSMWASGNLEGTYAETTATKPAGGGSSMDYNPAIVDHVQTPRIIRTMFGLTPTDVVNDGIASLLHGIGVTHLTISVFNSPADNPGWSTFELWEAAWNQLAKPHLDWCVANGFRIVATGDAFFRTEAERNWLHTSSFAEQAVRHVAAYLALIGICDGIEMVDEVGPDPAAYDPYDFIMWWRDEGGPSLAWPHQNAEQWEVPELSDRTSRYTTSQVWRHGRPPPYGATVWENAKAIEHTYTSGVGIPVVRPWWCLVGCNGPYYQKLVPGGEYQHGLDDLLNGGAKAQDVLAQAWIALAYGANGLRVYNYDWALWRNQRLDAVPGIELPDGLQTGAKPGDDRWAGVVAMMTSIASREVALTTGIVFAAQQDEYWVYGRRGGMTWAVNISERTMVAPEGTVVSLTGEAVGSSVPSGCVIFWTI
jgi:hypothetical protein